jgi:3-deoxy-D-manno-octulosonate 8-phosphate phosphatase (KDO 8-P phosphatase)
LLDVDGVLTDGTIFMGEGIELKGFNILDGHGIAMARRDGLHIGFVSGRPSPATNIRAKELGVELVYFTTQSKLEVVREVEHLLKIGPRNICYVGDDVVDLPALRHVGVPVAVANAVDEVKRAAKYVTSRRGGDGAVREVIELILKSQDRWDQALSRYVKD